MNEHKNSYFCIKSSKFLARKNVAFFLIGNSESIKLFEYTKIFRVRSRYK